MRILPREVDPMVYKMSLEDPGGASFAGIGGLGEQVRELREVCPLVSSMKALLINWL
jgi:26S proteasome regulatory subunit T4